MKALNLPSKCFKIALLNVRSIRNKVICLCESLNEKKINVCCITETWLSENEKSILVEFKNMGFQLYHQPRIKRGGGVGLIVKSDFKIQPIKNQPSFTTFEVFQTILTMKEKKDILFVICYRTGQLSSKTKKEFLDEMETVLISLEHKAHEIVICGDFNVLVNKKNDEFVLDFLELLETYGYKQIVNCPTHIAGGTLDLIFVRESTNIVDTIHIYNESNDILMSDHFMLELSLFVYPVCLEEKRQYLSRKTSKIDGVKFSSDLLAQLSEIEDVDFNSRTTAMFECISKTLNLHAPKVLKSNTRTTKVLNNDHIRQARRIKRQAERKYRKTGLQIDKQSFKSATSTLIKEVKETYNKFYSEKLNAAKYDSKATYKVVNHLLNKQEDKILPQSSNKLQLANDFIEYFHTKILKIRAAIDQENKSDSSFSINISSEKQQHIKPLEEFKPISEEVLKDIIKNTKNKYSSVDDIPADLLDPIINITFELLLDIINYSLIYGVFPTYLKMSHVTPIIKDVKSDKNCLCNYRPVTSAPFLSKLIERSVLNQLKNHLDEHQLNFKYQSAYKGNHSCETALIKIQDDIVGMLQSSVCVIVLFLDFSAAFDTVDHDILINKLKNQFGITGTALKWFESFLVERLCCVSVDGILSCVKKVKCGVPQGSVLGPVLFSLYVQEVNKIIDKYGFNAHMYADDIQIYLRCNDDVNSRMHVLKSCFEDIQSWAKSNYLKLNHNKSKLLIISATSCYSKIDYNLQDFILNTSVRNLGVMIDNHLNYNDQINKICRNGFFMLRNLWRISSKLTDVKLKIQIVHSLILSHIDYCNSLYIYLPNKQIKKLQRLMNAAVRFIFNLKKSDRVSITSLSKTCHFLPVQSRIDFKIALIVYRCLNNSAPVYLQELLELKNSLPSLRVFEDKTILKTPDLYQQNYKNRKFSIAAPRVWNKLPRGIRESNSLAVFKVKLKTHYFEECYGNSDF